MNKEYVNIKGYKIMIHSQGIFIVVDKKPSPDEAEKMTDVICNYLVEEGFFDKEDWIKVEIVRDKNE